VTNDSGKGRKSVTFNQNRRSRSAGKAGHVQAETAVKFARNTHQVACRPNTQIKF
jgi:ribosomal protein L21